MKRIHRNLFENVIILSEEELYQNNLIKNICTRIKAIKTFHELNTILIYMKNIHRNYLKIYNTITNYEYSINS